MGDHLWVFGLVFNLSTTQIDSAFLWCKQIERMPGRKQAHCTILFWQCELVSGRGLWKNRVTLRRMWLGSVWLNFLLGVKEKLCQEFFCVM